MKLLHSLPPYNFAGLEDSDFKSSEFVVLPVPFDNTASFGAGAKDGPHAIICASRFLELYDHRNKNNPSKRGIFTTDELEPALGDSKQTVLRIKDAVERVLDYGKKPIVLGGDHSVAIGCVQGIASKFEDVSVLCFDAHLDCWDELNGNKFSHACVGTQISDLTPSISKIKINEVIVGVRSAGANELDFCKKNSIEILYSEKIRKDSLKKSIEQILKHLKKNVYLTFDFDCLDPSIMPSTGTPEPEGLQFSTALQIIEEVAKKRRIVGADFCELSPNQNNKHADFLAAKLIYLTIGAIGKD